MALARTRSVSIEGIRGHVVEVEADIASGLPGTALVGSVDGSLSEARDRCRAAVVNTGRTWPSRRVTIALSPASLPKTGAHYDLAMVSKVRFYWHHRPGEETMNEKVTCRELAPPQPGLEDFR